VPQTLPNPRAQVHADFSVAASRDQLGAPAVLRLWHLASLDAPTVAAVWTLAFAWAAHVRLPPWIPLLLALAAWSVYIADRLLDARSAIRANNLTILRDRHRFHHLHRRFLLPITVAAALAAVWIVFTQMPIAARERNSALAVAALAYFTRVHSPGRLPSFGISRLLKKELLVGLLFTAACALPAISRASSPETKLPLLPAALFFAVLAWLNCHAIEAWESSETSPYTPQIQTQAALLGIGGMALALLLAPAHSRAAALVLCGVGSALLLALLDRFRGNITPLALRAAADLVLLTPLALLFA